MVGGAVVLAWVVLLLGWGRFWRATERLPDAPAPVDWREVVAVIPARDEAATIGEAVAAHRAQDYPGPCRVIVVDDASSDATAELARAAGAEVVAAPPLPHGWTGKLWALQTGLEAAARLAPGARWVWLTDADIVHAPATLRRLVAWGEARGLALVSLMARLDARGFWGGLLVPAFVFFFQKLYPFAWVNMPGHPVAAAAGGCLLVRRAALERTGGVAAIRGALIDDCALAARIKRGPPGRAIWLGLARDESVSRRDNRALGAIWAMVARTAFTQLRHSALLLVATVLGMAALYLGPPAMVAAGLAGGEPAIAAAGVLAWGLMALAYSPTLRLYGRPAWQGLALPLAALVYVAMTVDSARRHWLGRGGAWKGRLGAGDAGRG